mmetsp:Transcript_19749/g.27409  ORF Transcript_19749/g.27409 Transcript_19749/m.27409 type:complete len:328 (+) Transcript_19749:146-1129(+)
MENSKEMDKSQDRKKSGSAEFDLGYINALQEIGRKEHWWVNSTEIHLKGDSPAVGDVSNVYRAEWRKASIVVKCVKNTLSDTKKRMEELVREIAVWKTIRHPNIVMFLGVSFNPDLGLMVLLEEMPGGSLDKYMKQRTSIDKTEIISIAHNVANACAFLHSCKPPIVHGDIHPENILFTQFGEPRISDFGLSNFVADAHSEKKVRDIIRELYLAPEVLRKGGQAILESDVYAFGVLLLDLFTMKSLEEEGSLDSASKNDSKSSKMRYKDATSFLDVTVKFKKRSIPSFIYHMIVRCIQPDPGRRALFSDLADEFEKLDEGKAKCALM